MDISLNHKMTHRNRLPKIAIIRGPNLNQWETQNYESLLERFDITAYSTDKPNFDLSKIKLPIERLSAHDNHPAYMMGLESALFDKALIYSADTTWIFSYQAAEIKKRFGKKLICLQWENIPFVYEENEQMKTLKKVVRDAADHFVAVTERARDALIIEGVPSKRITVIPMGIDIERFKPDRRCGCGLRERLNIDKDAIVVLFTGRLVWEKGIYDFIYSAKLVLLNSPNLPLKFVVVGKGHERDRLLQQIGELGIEDYFILIEDYPYHEIHKLYNMADIFCLPSISLRQWKEQFGMVLIEAMACGIPVISTASGSIPEVIGDAGILVQANDPKALSEAVISLIQDNAKRHGFGQKGRERAVREFNSKEIAKRFGDLFDRVLKTGGEDNMLSDVPFGTQIKGVFSKSMITGQEQSHAELETKHTPNAVAKGVDEDYYRQERGEVACLVPMDAKKILDVGCGEGVLGKGLLDRGAVEVVGIEISSSVAKKAQENISSVICGDVENVTLPFERGYFDCIIFADVLEHLQNPLSVLNRFKAYLSDSGVIVASIPNVRYCSIINMLIEGRWEYQDYGILDKTHLRFFAKKDMEKMFQDAGLEITAINENLNPVYNTFKVSGLNEIEFGRVKIKNLKQDELRDLFVVQYIIRAKKILAASDTESKELLTLKIEIEEHLKHHPLDLNMLYKYAEVCRELGLFDEALTSLDKILLFEPERQEASMLIESIIKRHR